MNSLREKVSPNGEVLPSLEGFGGGLGTSLNKIHNGKPPNPSEERSTFNCWNRLLKFVFFSNEYFKKEKDSYSRSGF
jgi:hypothetical protein